MFRVTVGDKNLYVKFFHITDPPVAFGDERPGTSCTIYDADKIPSKDTPDVEADAKWIGAAVATGVSVLHPNDKMFNKVLGRKISLARALKSTNLFSKQDRLRVWIAYAKACNDPALAALRKQEL